MMTKAPIAADLTQAKAGDAPKEEDAAKDKMTAPTSTKLFPVKLNRNYVPVGEFEVTDAAPAPQAGVGTGNKVWAGSTIRLPLDEAKALIADKRAERADDLPS